MNTAMIASGLCEPLQEVDLQMTFAPKELLHDPTPHSKGVEKLSPL